MTDGDRSRWVVPIVAAVIAAVGTVIAALAPSLFGSDDEAARSSGDTTQSVTNDEPGIGRPTTREPAGTSTTTVIAYSGYEQISAVSSAVDAVVPG